MELQFFINALKHRPERAYSAMGALEAQGFPMRNVHIVWGKYWQDFDGVDALLDAAVDDGFVDMEALRDCKRPGFIAAMWSFYRTFRTIVAEQLNAVVFEDDCRFTRSYRYFEQVLTDRPRDMRIGIFGYHLPRDKALARQLTPRTQYWGAGVVNPSATHNKINYYTPAGIELIFSEFKGKRYTTIEGVIARLHETAGVYSLLKPIVRSSSLQGESDAMPGEGTERGSSLANVERWKRGYNVG